MCNGTGVPGLRTIWSGKSGSSATVGGSVSADASRLKYSTSAGGSSDDSGKAPPSTTSMLHVVRLRFGREGWIRGEQG